MVLSDTPVTPALQEKRQEDHKCKVSLFTYPVLGQNTLHAKREGREVGEGEEKRGEGGRTGKGERRSKNVGDYF